MTEETMKRAWKAGISAAFIGVVAVAAAGQEADGKKSPPVLKGIVQSVDAEGGKITIRRGGEAAWDYCLNLAPGAAVSIDGKAAGISDLSVGALVTCRLSEDEETVVAIQVETLRSKGKEGGEGKRREGDREGEGGERKEAKRRQAGERGGEERVRKDGGVKTEERKGDEGQEREREGMEEGDPE